MDAKEIGKIIKAAREKRGLSQGKLGALIGVKQASIFSIEAGETARSKYLPEIIQELGIDPEAVGLPKHVGDLNPEQPVQQHETRPSFPIYASAEGGPGEIIRSVDPVDFAPRPTHLIHVKDAYGLLVTGTSMFPEYKHGEMAIVEPSLPPMPGEAHVFYAEKHGEARATIKELRRQTSDKWLVSQHNPPDGAAKDFALLRRDWTTAHRVTGKYARR